MTPVDCIVPAYNEAPTIAPVIAALRDSGAFRTLLVVDDGSTDGTADVAKRAGAAVLKLPRNHGKGGAMQRAVAALPQDGAAIMFCDADLVGFLPEHARLLVREFERTQPAQCIGLRFHWGPTALATQLLLPQVMYGSGKMGGERVVQRWVLDRLPLDCWEGYAIETAINHVCDRHNGLTVLVPMRGVQIRGKVGKTGVFAGLRGHARMWAQMEATHAALRQSGGGSCRV